MSIDWNVICDSCKKYRHLGQEGGSHKSFGYGSKDEEGRGKVLEFISDHLGGYCGNIAKGTDKPLRIFDSNDWAEQPEYGTYQNLDSEEEDQE